MKRVSGLTMVELLMVAAIAGVVVAVLPRAVVQVSELFWTVTTQIETQRASRNALQIVSRRLRNAQAATVTVDRMDASQPFYSSIQFIPVGETAAVTFRQNGAWLEVVENSPAVTRRLVPNIGQISFFYPDASNANLINVHVVAEKVSGRDTKVAKSAGESVRLMN